MTPEYNTVANTQGTATENQHPTVQAPVGNTRMITQTQGDKQTKSASSKPPRVSVSQHPLDKHGKSHYQLRLSGEGELILCIKIDIRMQRIKFNYRLQIANFQIGLEDKNTQLALMDGQLAEKDAQLEKLGNAAAANEQIIKDLLPNALEEALLNVRDQLQEAIAADAEAKEIRDVLSKASDAERGDLVHKTRAFSDAWNRLSRRAW